MADAPNNLFCLVGAKNSPYLFWGVFDTFRGQGRAVEAAALTLERKGVICIAQLIQLDAEDVKAQTGAGEQTLTAINQGLRAMGFELGMRLPRRIARGVLAAPTL
jgi:hypothetical protein